MRNVRQAQRIFRDRGSQLLALGENEPVAANVAASMGLNPFAAGRALIGLSVAYSRPDIDRAGLRYQIEKAFWLTYAVPTAMRPLYQQHLSETEAVA